MVPRAPDSDIVMLTQDLATPPANVRSLMKKTCLVVLGMVAFVATAKIVHAGC
jgi:hypothetical protein